MKDEVGDARPSGHGVLARRPGEYASAGKVANLDQFATGTLSTVVGGDADGCRALDLRAAGGIDLRILPDRGFDLGSAWFRGVPLAWISAVGERAPLDKLYGEGMDRGLRRRAPHDVRAPKRGRPVRGPWPSWPVLAPGGHRCAGEPGARGG